MKEIKLRPHQEKFIAEINFKMQHGYSRVCGVSPCGSGKTVMAGEIVKTALAKGLTTTFIVHRIELVDQTAETFARMGLPYGIIAAGVDANSDAPIQIAMQQSLKNRLDEVPAPDLIICDECHHITASTYDKVIREWQGVPLIGLTATPKRADGVGLDKYFQTMVEGATAHELIEMGYLARYRYDAPVTPNLKGVAVVAGDYEKKALSAVMQKTGIITNIVENYQRRAAGTSTLAFCVDRKHSRRLAEQFNSAGIVAAHLDGETPKEERKQIVQDFRQKKIQVLCNVGLFDEGFDVPGVETVILARPTKSLRLFIQQAMRALRADPNNPDKVALILDCAGNWLEHGFPDDDRHWSLNGKSKKKDKPRRLKVCPQCGRVVDYGTRRCPNCGYIFPDILSQQTPYGTEPENKAVLDKIHSSDEWISRIVKIYEGFLVEVLAKGHSIYRAIHLAARYVKDEDELHILAKRSKTSYRYCYRCWQQAKAKKESAA